MDKQFVNIDDLVRQRLSGGEEAERSAPWRNMERLLDQEMPQKKRVALFYWRWMFGTMAVVGLLACLSLGGYELSSSMRSAGKAPNPADAAVNGPVMRNAVASNSEGRSSQLTDDQSVNDNYSVCSSVASHDNSPVHPAGSTAATIGQNNEIAATGNGTELSDNQQVIAENERALAANEALRASQMNELDEVVAAITPTTPVAETKKSDKNTQITHNQRTKTTSDSKLIASVTGKRKNNNTTGVATIAYNNTIANKKISKQEANNQSVAQSGKTKTSGNSGVTPAALPLGATAKVSVASTKEESTTGSAIAAAPATKKAQQQRTHEVAKSTSAASGSSKPAQFASRSTLASNKKVAAVLRDAAQSGIARNRKATRTLAGKKSISNSDLSASVTGARIAATTNSKPVEETTASVAAPAVYASSGPVSTKNAGIAKRGMSGKLGHTATASRLAKATPATARIGEPATAKKSVTVAEEETETDKHIEKLVLVYREQFTKTTDDDGYYKMDTISLLSITQPSAKLTAKKGATTPAGTSVVASAAPVAKNSPKAGSHTGAAAAEEEVQEIAPSAAKANESTAVVANSASEETAAVPEAPKAKQLTAAHKSAGSKKVEKLAETFNDLKYHVKGVQFAPGLTAGINSTFFAPESFKGFQFGVTGEFVFSDKLSVMAEAKYFHRMNNNYSLQDNYYTYTQVGGQYRKDLMLNSYSFSTLHSVEMPLSVRYTSGKFTFFAGGNFLYSFAVNTGAVAVPGPAGPAPVYVSSIGDDNAPKIGNNDFNSRFGVGYLFGASFQVSPNFSLDIRNVQTVWDNSGSSGAKLISNQLYRNPSLQISVGYRFGGGRVSED